MLSRELLGVHTRLFMVFCLWHRATPDASSPCGKVRFLSLHVQYECDPTSADASVGGSTCVCGYNARRSPEATEARRTHKVADARGAGRQGSHRPPNTRTRLWAWPQLSAVDGAVRAVGKRIPAADPSSSVDPSVDRLSCLLQQRRELELQEID